MKKSAFFIAALMCLSLSSCSTAEKLSMDTPENIYVTYCSGTDLHSWELTEDEINGWMDWLNSLNVSAVNLEESRLLLDYMYRNSSKPQYAFDISSKDSLETAAYFEVDATHGYIHINNTWYHIDNPTEPFNRY